MKRKIIFIILGALLILALIFILWFWFFGRHNKADVLPPNGSLGTASTTQNTGSSNGGNGNGQAPYGNDTNSGTTGSNTGSNGDGSGNQTQPTTYTYTTGDSTFSYAPSPYGVTWFSEGSSGTLGTGASGGGFSFTTTPINNINGGAVNGSPNISTVTGADGSQISIFSSLLTVFGGCLAQYGIEQLAVRPAVAGTDAAFNAIGSALSGIPILGGLFGGLTGGGQPTSDTNTHVNTATETVTQCLTRTLGRIAVAQITQSTVNWINSGFNGQPAYVQDYGQFFNKVADQSAGAFIQGSGLAFLCSPFQLQVKIAIAQSYANRKSSSAGSCTLTGVTGNIDSFLKGNFSSGGWPAFLQFTTVPANNPYAGYISGQIALNNKVVYDTNNAKNNISPGGFLSQQKCDTDPTTKQKTNCKIVTPGSAIEDSLHATFQGQLDQLQLGDSLDQILGALTNSLITKVLYGGLANAGQASASTGPNAATSQAQTLMSSIQAGVTAAQQYATIEQGAISDIQNSQRNLATLADCWSKVASSTSATSGDQAQGSAGFASTVSTITQLQTQVTQYNAKIAAANTSIARLQSLQTDLLLATLASDVSNVQAQFNSLKVTNNPRFYTSTDVTTAQQDRSSTQSSLTSVNQTTSTQLAQCYAIGQ